MRRGPGRFRVSFPPERARRRPGPRGAPAGRRQPVRRDRVPRQQSAQPAGTGLAPGRPTAIARGTCGMTAERGGAGPPRRIARCAACDSVALLVLILSAGISSRVRARARGIDLPVVEGSDAERHPPRPCSGPRGRVPTGTPPATLPPPVPITAPTAPATPAVARPRRRQPSHRRPRLRRRPAPPDKSPPTPMPTPASSRWRPGRAPAKHGC